MSLNFWQEKRPIFALAPMDNVTDFVFRELVAKRAAADVMFTEFTNVEGLFSKGAKRVEPRLYFSENQKPVVAQIWGMIPENYYKAGKLIKKLGFSGVDINFGCPDKSIVHRGACSGMINNPKLAGEIIEAVKAGAGNIPVSVKTRLGIAKIQTEEWIGFLLDQQLDAIIIHGRTARQMSKGEVNWEEIAKAVKMRDEKKLQTAIIGNGDIKSLRDARAKVKKYKVDGVMIGRGIFENFWIFDEKMDEASVDSRLDLLLEHARMFDQTWENSKPFHILNKFFRIYVNGFPGSANLRFVLMGAGSLDEVERIVREYRQSQYQFP